MGGAPIAEGLATAHFTHGFTDEKALYTGSTWGQLGVILYPVRCIARSGRPKKPPMLRTTRVCSRSLSSVRP